MKGQSTFMILQAHAVRRVGAQQAAGRICGWSIRRRNIHGSTVGGRLIRSSIARPERIRGSTVCGRGFHGQRVCRRRRGIGQRSDFKLHLAANTGARCIRARVAYCGGVAILSP
jgi:hypothetical protein